ncbi:MAG: putative Rossmann fold flavoprotein [Planctomycetota bacterium]|uniref:NAD(P)/FAD-dependent oxidoreductase n=1 Tax=Patiriisocius sp. Uisw_047 TaxID=3230969 RepID=UPI0039EB2FF9
MLNTHYDILVVGGGAAGFFTAINAAELCPNLKIAILERGKEVLTKVKISGGGRCNVTHAEFIPKDLTKNYPRGEKELLGPFHAFMTGDTLAWFEQRGVEIKMEEDGRMFPISDSSQTIIDCFTSEISRLKIELLTSHPVKSIVKKEECWEITTGKDLLTCQSIVMATGSNPKMWNVIESLGHYIIPPVPSLFTFNIKDQRIVALPGVATEASIKVVDDKKKVILESEGPLLITHWGMSGPAILKLSAWGARSLAPLSYKFEIQVNWLLHDTEEDVIAQLMRLKTKNAKQTLHKYPQFDLPKRLWQSLLMASGINEGEIWADISKKKLQNLANQMTQSIFQVDGKSTFKEEFVTAGGVDLKGVNFKTFESKVHTHLYFAGEVLNIDAITGGFNFQNAWTSGYIVAKAIADNV